MSEKIHVRLGARGYDIVISHESLDFANFVRRCASGTSALVVTDENVAAHAQSIIHQLKQANFRASLVVRPAGEAQKSLSIAAALYDQLIDLPADRGTPVVAVGGGVIGDLAGFVAATYARGLPLLMVPTTLLAMVDSSVGGKVAVNHPRAKNMIGVFHQPVGVWIDTAYLETLPEREYRSGLSEVVKYGVIMDAEFFAFLEKNADRILAREPQALHTIIARCCRLKADVVEKDEREETGLRVILNYGHTFAHAFETAAGYGSWLHGEAVAAGIVCASRLAERRGLIAADVTQRQVQLLQAFHLPVASLDWPIDDLLRTMRSDKKAVAGQMRFILPRRLGEVALFADVPEADVRAVLEV